MTHDGVTQQPSDDLVKIDLSRRGTAPLIAVQGELDLSNTPLFRDVLNNIESAPLVILDLSELTFIDSTGIGAIAQFGKRIRDAGGALHVVAKHTAVRKVLSITSLDQHFPVVDSLDRVPND